MPILWAAGGFALVALVWWRAGGLAGVIALGVLFVFVCGAMVGSYFAEREYARRR